MIGRRGIYGGLLVIGLAGCTSATNPDQDAGQDPQVAAITAQLETTNEQLTALNAKVEELEARLLLASSSPSPSAAEPAGDLGTPDPSDPLGRPASDDASEHALQTIRCTGLKSPHVECTVDRAAVNLILDDPTELARHARLVPHQQKGELRGFQFYGIRSTSMFKRFGLKNGDRLDRVNGEDITSLDKALGMFVSLRNRDRFELDMTRRDEPYTLRIDITPTPPAE